MSDIISWLTENDNPAVKYRTLTCICGMPPDDCDGEYEAVLRQKSVLRLFEKQDDAGLWKNDYGNHSPLRYLTAFAELGMQKDARLGRYITYTTAKLDAALRDDDLAGCSSALVLRALVMLGYHERPDVMRLIKCFSQKQLFDGGFMCKMKLDAKPDRKSCYKASIAAVLLYSECKLKGFLPDNADNLVNYFLGRNIFYSTDKVKKFDEGRLGWRLVDNFFPPEPMRMGLVQTIAALSILGAGNDPSMQEAWDMLENKKDENGRFILDGTLTKQPCSFGKAGMPNKWITYYAILAQKYRSL